MLIVSPSSLQSFYSISPSGKKKKKSQQLERQLCFPKYFLESDGLLLVTGAVVNFPGVMMTHHCTRLCWPGSLNLSNSLCVISILRSDSVSSPSAKGFLRRELLLTCQRFSSSRHSPGNYLMNSLWQLILNGDIVINPEMCYKSYNHWVEVKQTHLCHST